MTMYRRDLLVHGAATGAALLAASAIADAQPSKQPPPWKGKTPPAWDAVEARYDHAMKAIAALG